MVALDYPAITTPAKNPTSPTTSGGSETTRGATSSTATTTPTAPTTDSNSFRKNSNKADNNNNNSNSINNNNNNIATTYTGMESSVEDIDDDDDCCSTSTYSHKTNDNCKMKALQNKINNNNSSKNDVNSKAKSTKAIVNDSESVKRGLNLNLSGKELDESNLKSPKSPMLNHRLQPPYAHRGSVDLEDRKSLREALYQGIFLRHRKTIFAMGSFLKMLRNRNSHYNSMRCSSDDIDKVR